MKELRSRIKSILGILILTTSVGWLIEVATGDWEGSLFYVDIALLGIGISMLLPTLVSRLEGRVMDSKLFLITTIIVWTGTILSPFVLIAMRQGRLIMLGILIGMIMLLIFLFRMEGARESPSGKVRIYVFILLFPFAYALIIWSDLTLTASFFILVAVNILLYTQSLINYVVSFYRSKEKWKPFRFELPIEKPTILFEGMTSIQHLKHLELGFIETNTCQMELTITYEVNGLHYKKEGYAYNWYAPFEDRTKAFDWETDMKEKWINLLYDPEEPSVITGALGDKEEIEQMIFNYKQQQKKYQIVALGMAVLGFFLFFLKIAVT